MDYGEKQNLEDPRDNLNLDNWAPEHDRKSIGNKAIFSSENNNLQAPEMAIAPESEQVLVESVPQAPSINKAPRTSHFIASNIRTEGDHINKSAIVEIAKAKEALSQTGDINDFYEEIRDMMEKNLENSYNRKLAA